MAYRGLLRAHGELLLLRGVTQAGETARARGDWRERERELRVPKALFGWRNGKMGGWKIMGGWKSERMENI